MRILSAKMPLLLTLGVVLVGCNQSSDHSTNTPSRPLGGSAQAPGEYVLTVEGMV